jgi:hypothetical protein
MIVPGGGISLARGEEGDSPTGTKGSERWIACRPGFFLPVRVLSRLFRRLFLDKLIAAHETGQLQFFGDHTRLANPQAFAAYLAPLRQAEWVVYCKRPFGGPKVVLAYLARYTHRVAIANSRLIACDRNGVTFRWKDYRLEGRDRFKTMTLDTNEFIRRFLIHVLPSGFHRIRHYGLLANACRAEDRRTRTPIARGTAPPAQTRPARPRRCQRAEDALPPMSLLRRPHDHHRDVRAGINAAIPSDRPNGCDQDRHVMTKTSEPRQNAARLVRRFSTGYGAAHPNTEPAPPQSHRSSSRGDVKDRKTALYIPRNAVEHPTRPRSLHKDASPPAVKSP